MSHILDSTNNPTGTPAIAGNIYDDGDDVLTDPEKLLRVMANVVYTDINEGGDI